MPPGHLVPDRSVCRWPALACVGTYELPVCTTDAAPWGWAGRRTTCVTRCPSVGSTWRELRVYSVHTYRVPKTHAQSWSMVVPAKDGVHDVSAVRWGGGWRLRWVQQVLPFLLLLAGFFFSASQHRAIHRGGSLCLIGSDAPHRTGGQLVALSSRCISRRAEIFNSSPADAIVAPSPSSPSAPGLVDSVADRSHPRQPAFASHKLPLVSPQANWWSSVCGT